MVLALCIAAVLASFAFIGWTMVQDRRELRELEAVRQVKEAKRVRETMFNRGPVPAIAFGRRRAR